MNQREDQFFELAYQPLARAVTQGDLTAIRQQLAAGQEVNHVGKQDMTLLMWAIVLLAGLNQFEDLAKLLRRNPDLQLRSNAGRTLPCAVQDAAPNKGTKEYEWQKKVKQILEDRGVVFPVEAPYYDKPAWLPIRQRWYASPEGQSFKDKLEALSRDPEGFGDAYRKLFQAEDDAFEAWMADNNIEQPD